MLPLPVRLTDMQEAEERYRAAPPDERLELHATLMFYQLLTDGERVVLERRFANELHADPEPDDASQATKVAWDFRAREFVVAMLYFADEVLRAKMDMVGRVAADDDLCVLALTATGSIIELGRPGPDGGRAFVYRPSARPHQRQREGRDNIGLIKLGNRLELGGRRTSEIMVLASGPTLPPADEHYEPPAHLAGGLLFSPDADTGPEGDVSDDFRLGITRFRVLVDAAGNASDDDKPEIQDRMIELARELQLQLGEDMGLALAELKSFSSATGSRYYVLPRPNGSIDLERQPRRRDASRVHLANATIEDQLIMPGAPLVVRHDGFGGRRIMSCIFRIAAIELLEARIDLG